VAGQWVTNAALLASPLRLQRVLHGEDRHPRQKFSLGQIKTLLINGFFIVDKYLEKANKCGDLRLTKHRYYSIMSIAQVPEPN